MDSNDAARASAEALPADQNAEPKSLYQLLADYWTAYVAITRAINLTDSLPEGPTKERAWVSQFEPSNRLDEIITMICAYVPTRSADAEIKGNFLEGMVRRDGLEDSHIAALIDATYSVWSPKEGGAV